MMGNNPEARIMWSYDRRDRPLHIDHSVHSFFSGISSKANLINRLENWGVGKPDVLGGWGVYFKNCQWLDEHAAHLLKRRDVAWRLSNMWAESVACRTGLEFDYQCQPSIASRFLFEWKRQSLEIGLHHLSPRGKWMLATVLSRLVHISIRRTR